jgi:histidine decarboxylase
MNYNEIINNSMSSENSYLEGCFSSKGLNSYFLGVNFSVAKTMKDLSHEGSTTLDKIKAFDFAETASANISQINLIIVSSFCGPKGLIWGYDVCKTEKQKYQYDLKIDEKGIGNINIFKIDNLLDSFKKLTGTVNKPRFPFLPGSHVPCASKCVTVEERGIIYAALGLGIPKNRERSACLLMEDVGTISNDIKDVEGYQKTIIRNIVRSILKIGKNLNVQYDEIFVGDCYTKVEKGEIGCALVAAPYFTLAKDALPKGKKLPDISINEWEQLSEKYFLCNLK